MNLKTNLFITIFIFNLVSELRAAVPAAPVLSSVSADCSGNITVAGSGAASNAPITVFADLVNIKNSQADASGLFNFTITPTPLLTIGTHSITVTQTVGGGESNPSNAILLNIQNCGAPTLLSASADCSGNVTVVGSSAASNAPITVFADLINIGNGFADVSGNFNITITPTPLLTIGNHSITVTQTVSGSESSPSNAIVIDIKNCGTVASDVLTIAIFNKYGCS